MPPHIGGFVRRQVIEPLGLTVTDAAAALGVTRQALNNLLNEKAALTADMALRIERAFGPKADHLLRMQVDHDLAQARRRQAGAKVPRAASHRITEAGRKHARRQALQDLAAARLQKRKGGRAGSQASVRQWQIIARAASGELTTAEAARLLEVDPSLIGDLLGQPEAPRPAPPKGPRPSTGTR
jgi:addiction module HigA family antidote